MKNGASVEITVVGNEGLIGIALFIGGGTWLLLSLDRLDSNKLRITSELIANMLGVRREGVTETAGKLQKAGLIEYGRGCIKVLDRRGWRHGPVSATKS